MIRKFKILYCLSVFFVLYIYTAVDSKELSFNVQSDKKHYLLGEEISFTYVLLNLSDNLVVVKNPSILQKTVKIEVTNIETGEKIGYNGHWEIEGYDRLSLKSNEKYRIKDNTFYIPFCFGLRGGLYRIRFLYYYSNKNKPPLEDHVNLSIKKSEGKYANAYEMYEKALYSKFFDSKTEDAVKLFEKLIVEYPDFILIPKIKYYYAMILHNSNQTKGQLKAIRLFEDIIKFNPDSYMAARAKGSIVLLKSAIERRTAGENYKIESKEYAKHNKKEAKEFERAIRLEGFKTKKIEKLEAFIKKYPSSFFSSNAQAKIGYYFDEIGKTNEAEQAMEKLIQNYPNSYYAKKVKKEARWDKIWKK